MNSILRKRLSLIYWWGLRNFLYNKLNEKIFYPHGYPQKINGVIIRMPFRYCWVYPSSYEIEKTNLIRAYCKPGSVAIDIGAHIGVFSFFLAKQVGPMGKVYSFEPTPFIFDVLLETIKYNYLEDIIVPRQQAVTNTHSDVTFFISKGSKISNANSISMRNLKNSKIKSIKVKAVTLDNFLEDHHFENLSFIKIDAEGAEFEILKGGQKVIKKYKPFITLEIHPQSFAEPEKTQKEIFYFVYYLGYKIYKNNVQLSVEEFCGFLNYFEVVLIPNGTQA